MTPSPSEELATEERRLRQEQVRTDCERISNDPNETVEWESIKADLDPATWCERSGGPGHWRYTRRTETENGGFSVVGISEAEWQASEFGRVSAELERLGKMREDADQIEREDFVDLLDVAESLRAMFDDIPGGHPFETW